MPAADTKTQQLLYALGHRGASTAAANGCCNTKTQDYILDAITRITNEEDARADGDTNLQNQINNKEGKTITGAGAPTTSTEAANVGQQYYDTTNEKLYYCSAIDTTTDPYTYTWEKMDGGIPTNATFWGASYNSTNNSVSGNINFDGDGVLAIPSGSSGLLLKRAGTTMMSWTGENYLWMNNHKISSLADPTNPQDATTKHYVDTLVGDIETILATLTTGTGTGD